MVKRDKTQENIKSGYFLIQLSIIYCQKKIFKLLVIGIFMNMDYDNSEHFIHYKIHK